MHICVGNQNLIIIGSDNVLSPGRRQAIIWTNAGMLFIGSLRTNFSEILIKIQTFSFIKCIWKCRLLNGIHFVPGKMSLRWSVWRWSINSGISRSPLLSKATTTIIATATGIITIEGNHRNNININNNNPSIVVSLSMLLLFYHHFCYWYYC